MAALRKRSALVDMTNAGGRRPLTDTSEGTVISSKDGENIGMVKSKIALRDSNGTAAIARGKAASSGISKPVVGVNASSRIVKPSSQVVQRTDEGQERLVRVARKASSALPLRTKPTSTASSTTYSRSNSVQSDASRRTASSREDQQPQQQTRGTKRVKTDAGERRITSTKDVGDAATALTHKRATKSTTDVAAKVIAKPAKDEGWEDLDAEDADDPLMVAEYVNEIFDYMREIELDYMPSGDYIDLHRELTWDARGVLVDWLIEIHSKFRLVPETLFLAQNIIDRFLSLRTVSLEKLQLVGLTAMFIAAKYEEVLCPSVHNFLYVADHVYTDEEMLKAERYMLKIVKFNLSYASPMNFLRRISKADNYDIQTRTVAKFFMEISLVDYRLLEHPPSAVAAAAVWNARLVLERGPWNPTLVHYSGYSVEELLPTAELMIDYCLRPVQHERFIRKYSAKKFMKAATYVFDWGKKTYGNVSSPDSSGEGSVTGEETLRVDLFAQCGLDRPSPPRSSSNSEQASALDEQEQDRLRAFDYDEQDETEVDEGQETTDRQETSQDAHLLSDVTNIEAAIRARKH